MNESTRFVITLPPPTPNGGLHLGHLSGPFLSGDILAKATKLTGGSAFVTCYSDVNQSYVRVTAQRQNIDPVELADYWTRSIRHTFKNFDIDVDDYYAPDDEANNFVKNLFHDLFRKNVLVKKAYPFFQDNITKELLDEAGVSGYCCNCLASCKCGICEACGQLTNALNLIDARNAITGSKDLVVMWLDVMVIELERFRKQIQDFYSGAASFRQRYKWLVEDAVSRPLPDFPVSVPSSWGIAVDLPGFDGQRFNPWPEIMAQLVHSYRRAERCADVKFETQPINFFGFDNSYFYAILHVALLTQIDDGKWLPKATIINEFYNLEHSKFSTSNGHVIWADDCIDKYSSDEIRFYAALNCPGFEKANYTEDGMVSALDKSLHNLWGSVSEKFNLMLSLSSLEDFKVPCSTETRKVAAKAEHTILKSMSVDRFHVRQAAEDCLHLLGWIDRTLSDGATAGDAVHLLATFARACYPLMPAGCNKLHNHLRGCSVEADTPNGVFSGDALPVALFRAHQMSRELSDA